MLRRALLLVALCSATTLARQTLPPGSGLIVGQVVDAVTGRGVPEATLMLRQFLPVVERPTTRPGAEGYANLHPNVVADEEGRFYFTGVRPGPFEIEIQKAGYLNGGAGQEHPGGAPQRFEMADGERRTGLRIPLWKTSVIAGTLTDEHGDPVVNTVIRVLRRDTRNGWTTFTPTTVSERTDDLGEFRVTGLAPGTYLVAVPGLRPTISHAALAELSTNPDRMQGELMRVTNEVARAGSPAYVDTDRHVWQTPSSTPRPPAPRQGQPLLTYPPTFYPAATDLALADLITLRAGDEFTTAHIRISPVPTTTIVGRIVGPADQTEPLGRTAVRLISTSLADILSPQVFSISSTLSETDGSFVMLGVPDGRYTAVAESVKELPIAQGGMVGVTASVTVDVATSSISEVTLPLQPMAPLTGRLVFEGGEVLDKELYNQSVAVQSASAIPLPAISTFMDPTGPFKLLLRPGRYFLSPGQRGPWAVKSITQGGRSVYDSPVEIGTEPVADVVITYARGVTAKLDGIVTLDSGGPAAGSVVVVFPADAALRRPGAQPPHRFFTAAASTAGAFVVPWAAPGSYLVAAIRTEDVADWRAPALLEPLSRAAQAITLTSGGTHSVRLQVASLAAREPSPVLRDPVANDEAHVGHGPSVWEGAAHVTSTQQRDGPRSAPTVGTGRLEGVVVSADELPQPIRNVRVSVRSNDDRFGVTVSSDEVGRFVVEGLAAGEYRLTVDKAGWLGIPFGATRPGGTGTGVTLSDAQQRAGITMRMARGAALSGGVTNAQSVPMAGIRVEALRKQLRQLTGEWQLTSVASDTTDDRGVFRIHSLRAGDYVLRATDPAAQDRSAGTPVWRLSRDDVNRALALGARPASALPAAVSADFGPVTYPDPTGTSLLSIKTGQDLRGLAMVMSPEPLSIIRGSVRRSDGLPVSNVALSIFRGGPDAELLGLSTILVGEGRADAQGRFQFRPVQAGTYTVRASVDGAQPMWASETLMVSGPTEVSLGLQPAMTVRGRVILEGTDIATTPVPPVQVWLLPAGTGSELNGPRANAAKDGTFTLTGVFPGRYSFTNTAVPGGDWSWRASVVNGRASFDSTLVVEPGQDVAWELRFTREPTRLTGLFTDATGRPASEYTLVVFAEDRTWWHGGSRVIRTTRPNTDGTFTVVGLPPGTYHLAAVTDIEDGNQYSPEWLTTLLPASLTVVLRDKSVTTQDIRIGGR